MKRPRLLLTDDHTIVTEGYRRLLDSDFDVVGTVHDGEKLLKMAPVLKPDVIILDISMPLITGFDACRRLQKMIPKSKVIFLTMHADPVYAVEAFRVGACAYLLKECTPSELIQAIREVLQNRFYLTPLITKETLLCLIEQVSEPGQFPSKLTPRQREVVRLVAEGCSTKEIADILKISGRAVDFHKSAIMEKLGIHSNTEFVKFVVTRDKVLL